jgi:hypothetical protein
MSTTPAAPREKESANDVVHAPPVVRKPSTGIHWLILTLSTCVIAASFFFRVQDEQGVVMPWVNQPFPGICTFRRIVGINCPGCGMTRSFISIAHGQWARAWDFNPVGFLFFPVVAFQIPYRILQLTRIRRGQRELSLAGIDQWVLIIIAFALLTQWIVAILKDYDWS